MWRASCVDSLFPLLLCRSPCSDTSPSPSPKFPSFRAGSEVRDCDLPSGWVKDSPPPTPSMRDGPAPFLFPIPLFCIHLTPFFLLPWITWQCAERAAVSGFSLYFGLFPEINKGSCARCMEPLCRQKKKKKKKKNGKEWETLEKNSFKSGESIFSSRVGVDVEIHSSGALMSLLPTQKP